MTGRELKVVHVVTRMISQSHLVIIYNNWQDQRYSDTREHHWFKLTGKFFGWKMTSLKIVGSLSILTPAFLFAGCCWLRFWFLSSDSAEADCCFEKKTYQYGRTRNQWSEPLLNFSRLIIVSWYCGAYNENSTTLWNIIRREVSDWGKK